MQKFYGFSFILFIYVRTGGALRNKSSHSNSSFGKPAAPRKNVGCLSAHISCGYRALNQSVSLLTGEERYFLGFIFRALLRIHLSLCLNHPWSPGTVLPTLQVITSNPYNNSFSTSVLILQVRTISFGQV